MRHADDGEITKATRRRPTDPHRNASDSLTPRERDIVAAMVRACGGKELASPPSRP